MYTEAVAELRKTPLIIDADVAGAFRFYKLTIAHIIPFHALQQIKHVHFVDLNSFIAVGVKLLWEGSKITKDINHGHLRQMAFFSGMLGEGKEWNRDEWDYEGRKLVESSKKNAAKGKYALSKISVGSLPGSQIELDLTDDTTVSLNKLNDFNIQFG